MTINLDNQPVSFLIDSGARGVSVIDRSSLRKLQRKINVTPHPSQAKIYTYGSDIPLPLDGVIYSSTEFKGTHHLARFHISSSENSGNVLGRETATALGLLEL